MDIITIIISKRLNIKIMDINIVCNMINNIKKYIINPQLLINYLNQFKNIKYDDLYKFG